MTRRLAALVATALIACASSARADDAKGGAGFLIYNAQFVAPNEVGADVSTAGNGGRRLRVLWSDQIPLGIFGGSWSMGDDERDVPLMRHRLVFGLGLALGRQTLPGGDEVVHTTLDGRVGYRYRLWHTHGLAPFFGAGTTLEPTSGGARLALSPELGVHVGSKRLIFPGVQLRVQSDVFPALSPHARFVFTVGYTLL